eukprot:10710650-Lingulodinium_polyedra.AAC.1
MPRAARYVLRCATRYETRGAQRKNAMRGTRGARRAIRDARRAAHDARHVMRGVLRDPCYAIRDTFCGSTR